MDKDKNSKGRHEQGQVGAFPSRNSRENRKSRAKSNTSGNSKLQTNDGQAMLGDQTDIEIKSPSNKMKQRRAKSKAKSSGKGTADVNSSHEETGYLSESTEEQPGAVRVTAAGRPIAFQQHLSQYEDDRDLIFEEVGLPTAVKAETAADEEAGAFRQTAKMEAEKQFLAKLTPAKEYERRESSVQSGGRRRYWIFGTALVVVVVAAAVLIVMLSAPDDETENLGSSTPPATPAPTIFVDPDGSANLCKDAVELSQSMSITGTTINGTPDGNLDTCGDVSSNGVGVWYTMEGTGTRMSVSTCDGSNFDTQISVFSGSSCDGGLKCEYGNDQRTNCGQDASQLIFLAEKGQRYYIRVHGLRSSVGIFSLTVEPLQDNDECITATRFESFPPGSFEQATIFGTNRFSSMASTNSPACGALNPGPGAWFVFTARDTRFIQARIDDFPSNLLSVFSGDGCGNLQCVASGEGFVMWTAIQGTNYYIFVHGKGSSVGDFALTLLPGGLLESVIDNVGSDPEDNKYCEVAKRLNTNVPVTVSGNTDEGEFAIVPSCGNVDSKGLWYKFTGSGSQVTLSTCQTVTRFDTRLSVFTGGCWALRCVGAGENDCGNHGMVELFAEPQVEYLIFVHGTNSEVGTFSLSIGEVGDSLIMSPRDTCEGAESIFLDGTSRLGSLDWAQFQDVGLCGNTDAAAPAVYYKVIGTGLSMIASTCNRDYATSARIKIYGGDCNSFDCIDDIQEAQCGSQMSVIWNSIADVTYYIQVYGSEEGNFSLDVEEIDENFLCKEASASLELGSSVLGSTRIPQAGPAASCTQAENVLGVWYQVHSDTTGTLSVSACSSITNFNPQISVYDGCGSLQCLAANNGFRCGDGSAASWMASAGKIYYILVRGSGEDDFGNFALSLGSENDFCATSELVQPDGDVIIGSTSYATMDDGSISCFRSGVDVDGPGVWYKVIGKGGLLSASTCTAETEFDTKLSIYEGRCGDLSCIAGTSCESEGTLTWFAADDETYYILVHGFQTGVFGLIVRPFENNSCGASLTVETESSVALASTDSSLPHPCGLPSNNTQQFWYTMIGTGGEVNVDTCAGSSRQSQVSLFDSECSDLSCSDPLVGACSITFDSVFNQQYQILVSEREGEAHELYLESSNFECERAFGPLLIGGSTRGSTVGSSTDVTEACDGMFFRGPGVWYYFIGNGLPMTAFTCDSFTNFDTQISVYAGINCDRLRCVGAMDDNCGYQSWMTIPTVAGEKYYLLLSGKGTSAGNFVLSLR